MEASKLYIKGDDQKSAIACLQRAKNLYIQSGKVTQAARACKELATNIKDGDKAAQEMAMQTFLEAAKLYDSDSQYTDMVRNPAPNTRIPIDTSMQESEVPRTPKLMGIHTRLVAATHSFSR